MTLSSSVPPILDLLRARSSPSVFDPRHEMADADLRTLLEAARWSPSCGNAQPWAFMVGRRGDATHRHLLGALSRGNAGWVPPASVVLVAMAQTTPSGKPMFADYARYDLGQAVAHLCVQATSMGLGVHQFAGFDHEALATAYDVPPEWTVLSGIAIGRPWPVGEREGVDPDTADREQRERKRRPLSELAFDGTFGVPAALKRD